MHPSTRAPFVSDLILATLGRTKKILSFRKGQMIFAAGDRSDFIFLIQHGSVKLTVGSREGKEAVTAVLEAKQFFGEEILFANRFPRSSNAIAVTDLQVTPIERNALLRVLSHNRELCEAFISSLVGLIAHLNGELADSLLYNSEQRLIRALLSISKASKPDAFQRVTHLSQQDLASMIGTSRQRVNALMQRFKKLGLVDYSHGLRVHGSMRWLVREE
jgi:CRP-like cAMP-binding protein